MCKFLSHICHRTQREAERRQAKMDELVTKQKRMESAYQNDRATQSGDRCSFILIVINNVSAYIALFHCLCSKHFTLLP